MNFLAHVFLSQQDTDLMVGNFVADFLRGKAHLETYPLGVLNGILLHRKIDKFTDKHPKVKAGYKLLKPLQGRYASVTLDIYSDYFLVKHWAKFTDLDLNDFTQTTYRHLENYMDLYPKFLKKRLPLMIADDWLVRYGTWDGLEFTFSKMSNRASKSEAFQRAVKDLRAHESALEANFLTFFPDLMDYVDAEMKKLLDIKI